MNAREASLRGLELSGDVGETYVSDFIRPVKVTTPTGVYFLLLQDDAGSPAAWDCGETLYAIPCVPLWESPPSVADILAYPRASTLRVASLATRDGILRIDLRLSGTVGSQP